MTDYNMLDVEQMREFAIHNSLILHQALMAYDNGIMGWDEAMQMAAFSLAIALKETQDSYTNYAMNSCSPMAFVVPK